jgi:RHS repeat-associated protein
VHGPGRVFGSPLRSCAGAIAPRRVRELLDSSGTAFAYYGYDAYGRPTETTTQGTTLVPAATAAAIASAQPLRYASYVYDSESGYYYCSARYYDPAVAAFISKDPVKADGEESAYQYCAGDPVGGTDPSGMKWIGKRVENHKQKTKAWCWAAASVAVLKFRRGLKSSEWKRMPKHVHQEDVVDWLFNHGSIDARNKANAGHPVYGPAPDIGATPGELGAVLRAFGLNRATEIPKRLPLPDLRGQLKREQPVCAFLWNDRHQGHWVVIDRVTSGSAAKMEFMDPLQGKRRKTSYRRFPWPCSLHYHNHWDESVVVRL